MIGESREKQTLCARHKKLSGILCLFLFYSDIMVKNDSYKFDLLIFYGKLWDLMERF